MFKQVGTRVILASLVSWFRQLDPASMMLVLLLVESLAAERGWEYHDVPGGEPVVIGS